MDKYKEVFFGLNPGDKVMVAYSGGVDSAYAAALCRDFGFQVETVTMSLFSDSRETAEFAERTARDAGYVHHTLDLSAEFREEIMHHTWRQYTAGLTPNPCAVCNIKFKFGRLREYALQQNCKALITGHYTRICQNEAGEIELRKGICQEKDQSYFLFGVPAESLAFCRTPLGILEKTQVRSGAEEKKLESAKSKESQDVCFGGDSMPETLSEMFPEPPATGNFLSDEGKILGQHKGIQFYTIGQRKGTGVALGCPAYISSIDGVSRNIVISTDSRNLFRSELIARNCNYFADLPEKFSAMVRIRYRSKAVLADVERLPDGRAKVIFSEPVRAAAPGQGAVFYDDDRVLGGGWIEPFGKD